MSDIVDAQTMELVLTNLALGLACAVLLAIVAIGVAVQLIGRRNGPHPDDSPPTTPESSHPERTLSDQRSELPDGWPPLPDTQPDSQPEACSTARY